MAEGDNEYGRKSLAFFMLKSDIGAVSSFLGNEDATVVKNVYA